MTKWTLLLDSRGSLSKWPPLPFMDQANLIPSHAGPPPANRIGPGEAEESGLSLLEFEYPVRKHGVLYSEAGVLGQNVTFNGLNEPLIS